MTQASSSTTVGSSLNPSVYGQAVSFTATVAAVSPGTGTPTGTVQFNLDGSAFGSPVTLVSGTATSTSTTTLTVGNHVVTAVYSGNSDYGTSTGTLASGQTVTSATAGTVVTSSVNPSVYGQSVTFTATISGEYGLIKTKRNGIHSEAVTGTVSWSADTGCGTTTVTSGTPGTATCTTSGLPLGNSVITATYNGDCNHQGSTGTLSGGQNVTQASSSTTVGSSLNPSVYGQAVSFTATVAAVSPGTGTPAGTVQFNLDGSAFGSPVTLVSGTATSTSTSTLAVGNHVVTAVYAGNSDYGTSTGTLASGQTVSSATAGTVVTSSVNPSVYGQSVTFTATISGQYGLIKRNGIHSEAVTGTVSWSADTGCGTTTVTSGTPGVATCTTSGLPLGNSVITATYNGDSNHTGSTGTLSGGQNVTQASSSTTVGSSLNPSVYGQAVSFTATVAAVSPGTGTPAGTVQFNLDGSAFGSPVTLVSGTATSTSTNTLTVGNHVVTAVYSGNSDYGTSTGTLASGQTVTSATAGTVVTSSVNPSVYGQSVTFTATISGEYGLIKTKRTGIHSEAVTGTVSWSADTGCGTTTVTSGTPGTATCTTSGLPLGNSVITATYNGDSNHQGSSGTLSGGQNVTQASSSTTVGSSLNPSVYGQAVSFTATVAAVSPGTGTPAGTVQFNLDGSAFGSPVTLVSGTATSTSTSTLAVGQSCGDGGVRGQQRLRDEHGDIGERADGEQCDGGHSGDVERESVGLWAVGDLHGDDQRAVRADQAERDSLRGGNGHGFLERGYRLRYDHSDFGHSWNRDLHDVGSAAGQQRHHGDLQRRQQPPGQQGTLSGGQNVTQASSSTTVGSSLNPSVYGQAVSFTATVAAVSPGTGTPTGTVQFNLDGSAFGSPVTLVSGTATSTSTNTLTVGNHVVTAVYAGNSDYGTSTGTLASGQTVTSATAGTVVTSSVNPSVYGQSVTFTATISGEYGLIKTKRAGIHSEAVTGTVSWSADTGCGTTTVTSGTPGIATLHDLGSAAGQQRHHGDLQRGQQPPGEQWHAEWRAECDAGQQQHDGRVESESVGVRAGGKLHGDGGGGIPGHGNADWDGAVQPRWQRLRFTGDAGLGHGDFHQHEHADRRESCGNGGVRGQQRLRDEHRHVGERADGDERDGGHSGDVERESVGLWAVGDVHGDDLGRVRLNKDQAERDSLRGGNGHGFLERGHGLRDDHSDFGHSWNRDLHDFGSAAGQQRHHGDLQRGLEPPGEQWDAEWRAECDAGQQQHDGRVESESVGVRAGGELHGDGGGGVAGHGNAGGDGAVQPRRQRLRFTGDAGLGHGDFDQHVDLGGGQSCGHGGVRGQQRLRHEHGDIGERADGDHRRRQVRW